MNKARNRKKVKSLERYIEELSGKDSKFKVLRMVYNDVILKKITLVDPDPPKDFIEYLCRADYSLWLWATGVLVIMTISTITLAPLVPGLNYIRYVVGSIAVLFLPGYVTVEALYPREEELTPLERLALSIGLSLAIVPLIGLALNYTPWGIRLTPILVVLSIYITMMAMIASYRKYVETQKSL